jgi:hypothetical protein
MRFGRRRWLRVRLRRGQRVWVRSWPRRLWIWGWHRIWRRVNYRVQHLPSSNVGRARQRKGSPTRPRRPIAKSSGPCERAVFDRAGVSPRQRDAHSCPPSVAGDEPAPFCWLDHPQAAEPDICVQRHRELVDDPELAAIAGREDVAKPPCERQGLELARVIAVKVAKHDPVHASSLHERVFVHRIGWTSNQRSCLAPSADLPGRHPRLRP